MLNWLHDAQKSVPLLQKQVPLLQECVPLPQRHVLQMPNRMQQMRYSELTGAGEERSSM